jgi:hypothetical protein
MTTVPISSVITKSFIQGFQNAASSGSKSSNPLQQSSAVSLSSSLRYGAQVYGSTIQNLNSAIGFLNISDGKLDTLLELTDKMITITETATKRGIGSDTRLDLDKQFRRLADQFQKTVTDSASETRDPLSIEDITAVFTLIGLDKEKSDSITKLFKEFLTSSTDPEILASEEYLARRPINVPADASTEYKRAGSAEFTFSDSVNYPEDALSQTPSELIHFDINKDGIEDLIGSYENAVSRFDQISVFLGNGDGSFGPEIISDAATDGGVSKIATLDFDGDGFEDVIGLTDYGWNLWTGDGTGNLQTYFTESGALNGYSQYAVATAELVGAGTSKDLVRAYYQSNIISVNDGETFFGGATASTILPAANWVTDFTLVDINQDTKLDIVGGYGGTTNGFFISLGNGDGTFSVATTTDTPTPASDRIDDIAIGDFDNDFNLDIIGQGVGNSNTFIAFNTGSSFGTVDTIASNSTFPVVQTADLNNDNNIDIIYQSETTSGLSFYNTSFRLGNGDGTFAAETVLPNAPTLYSAQGSNSRILAFDADRDNTIDIITTNNIDAGLSSNVLTNPATTTKIRAPIPSDNFTSIFDSERTIANRVEAYRLTTDLKSLREQIIGNKKALQDARDIVGKNMDLVRATGLALLELSEQISDSDTAEQVAEMVRSRIVSKASAALSQAENLTPLTIATLALQSSSEN